MFSCITEVLLVAKNGWFFAGFGGQIVIQSLVTLALRSWNLHWLELVEKNTVHCLPGGFFTNPPLIGVSYSNFKAIFWCHITPFTTITRWWFFTKPFEKYDGLVNLDHCNPQGPGWKFKKCLKPTTYSSCCWMTFPKKKHSFLSRFCDTSFQGRLVF